MGTVLSRRAVQRNFLCLWPVLVAPLEDVAADQDTDLVAWIKFLINWKPRVVLYQCLHCSSHLCCKAKKISMHPDRHRAGAVLGHVRLQYLQC